LPAAVALDAAFLVDEAAFFAVSLAFDVAFLAVVLALVAVFFAVDFALFTATAAANFAALALFKPAFSSPALPAFAIFAAVFKPAAWSFFAVAAPTPGSSVKSSPLEPVFFAMVSPEQPYHRVFLNYSTIFICIQKWKTNLFCDME
jgi:hypothetical protein